MDADPDRYTVWRLPHPMLLHWVLNPGLAVNELLLGQRIPRVTWIDRTSRAPLMERQVVPCPHCSSLHDGRLWSGRRAFGHWFGYVCPSCQGRIPCLWNLTSLVLLALTAPLWIAFKPALERRWLAWQRERLAKAPVVLPEAKQVSWLGMGLGFGALMFCFLVLPPALQGQLTPREIGLQALVWLVGGLVFGGAMRWFMGRRR